VPDPEIGALLQARETCRRLVEVAKRFLIKANRCHGGPEKVTIDGSEANVAALLNDTVEDGTTLIIRQVTYVHNIIEQDHRGVQCVTRPRIEGKSCDVVQGMLAASEFMRMMQKRQRVVGRKSGPYGGRTVLRPGCLFAILRRATTMPRNAYDRPTRGRR
jgi:transposase-like protein